VSGTKLVVTERGTEEIGLDRLLVVLSVEEIGLGRLLVVSTVEDVEACALARRGRRKRRVDGSTNEGAEVLETVIGLLSSKEDGGTKRSSVVVRLLRAAAAASR